MSFPDPPSPQHPYMSMPISGGFSSPYIHVNAHCLAERMSFPDPPSPQHPYMSMPISGGFSSPYMMENQQTNSISEFENPPPLKRPKNSESPQKVAPFPANNQRANTPNVPGNKGTCHIFYKTRLCAKFTEGTCRNGENCTFAHGMEDLREPPPNWQDLIREKERGPGGGSSNSRGVEDQRILIHRMKICKKYYNGEECPYGDKCNFLHERGPPPPPTKFKADVFRQRESFAISIGTTGDAMVTNNNFDQSKQHVTGNLDAYQSKTSFWKTKLCSKWEIGQCPFGERCHYAHGFSELKYSATTHGDAGSVMNSGSTPANPFSSAVSGQSLCNLVIGAPPNESGEDKKASRWKVTRKINRIYGDWLDDGSPNCSPTKDEI